MTSNPPTQGSANASPGNALYTKADYLQALISAVQAIDPDISVVEGDVVNCLFSAVAEVLSASSLNQIDPSTFFDLSTKTGAALDDFAALLGMTRMAGTYASADLQFYLASASSSAISIPVGCQIEDGAGHVFATTSQAILQPGQMSISVPATAQAVGTASNVEAYTLIDFVSTISSALNVQNPLAATGGTNPETDAHFRERIQSNLFYRQIGTPASFNEALVQIDDNTRVTTIGAQKWHDQYAELSALPSDYGGGIGFISNVRDAQYIYPSSSFLIKNEGTANQTDYQEGVAYQFNLTTDAVRPAFEVTETGSLDLSAYSGSLLDRIGNKIGLPRDTGTVATGLVYFSVLASQNTTVIIPAFTKFVDSAGNTYQTTKNAYIQPLDQSGSAVPFTALSVGNAGTLTEGTSVVVEVANTAPGNLYGTVSAFTQGTPAWTDAQYVTQLEDFLANQAGLSLGDMVYTAFQYNPQCSRCDIPNGIADKVDIFIDGQQGQTVTETGLISLVQTAAAENGNWVMADGNYVPEGSYLQLLATPAADGLSTGTASVSGASYAVQFVRAAGKKQLSTRAQNALLFSSSNLPVAGDTYTVELIQNKALIDSQYQAEKISPLSLDVLVHEGFQAQISLSLAVVPLPGSTKELLVSSISSLLTAYFASLPFGAFVNTTEILSSLLASPYIRTVQFATDDPIQVAIPYSTASTLVTYTDSFWLNSNEYPVLANVSFNYGSDTVSTAFGTGSMPNIFIS